MTARAVRQQFQGSPVKSVAIAVAALLLAVSQATAQDDAAKPALFGYRFKRASGPTCAVTMDLDEGEFIQAIPSLVAIGLLNGEMATQTRINVQPTLLSFTYMLEVAPETIKSTFDDDPKAQDCKFTQYLTSTDDLGNTQRKMVVSFNFNRALYLKVNWPKFEYIKLPKVAPNFLVNPEINMLMEQESVSMPSP